MCFPGAGGSAGRIPGELGPGVEVEVSRRMAGRRGGEMLGLTELSGTEGPGAGRNGSEAKLKRRRQDAESERTAWERGKPFPRYLVAGTGKASPRAGNVPGAQIGAAKVGSGRNRAWDAAGRPKSGRKRFLRCPGVMAGTWLLRGWKRA